MVERRQAEKTSFVIARETETTGSPVTDRTKLVKSPPGSKNQGKNQGKYRRYVVTAWNHDEDSEKQSSDSLRAGRADVFGEDGYLWGSGNIEIEIPSEEGFLDIIQGVLADPKPVSVAIPDKVLVPTGTNVSDVVKPKYFKDTKTDVTFNVVDTQPLGSIVVVNGENLSGSGNKTVAHDLGAYDPAPELIITPNASADLTNSSTDGTINITYTDMDGSSHTVTLTFADGVKTVAQKTRLPAGATVTRVTTTGWQAGTFIITANFEGWVASDKLCADTAALTLTVTLTSPTLTDAAVNGTIVLRYEDSTYEEKDITLAFTDLNKGTPQTATLPAGATLVSVTEAGFSGGSLTISTSLPANIARNPAADCPGQLRFEFSDENAGGQVIVRGVRRVGLASNDTLPMRETFQLDEAGPKTTNPIILTKYFHKISKVEIKAADGSDFTTGTVEVTSVASGRENPGRDKPALYKTTLKTVNDEFPGWSIEPEVGGEPWLVTKGVPIGAEIEVGESIGATIDILSNRVDKRRTIEGGDEEQFTPTAVQYSFPNVPKENEEFAFVGRRFFSGYGRYLEIDGEAVICDAAPVNISHNYDFSQGKIPGRFRRDTEPTARRNVTSSVQTKYESGTSEEDIFVRWDEKFRNNESVSVRIVTYQWLGNGKQLAIIYTMPNCEIQSPVRVAATGPGTIPITIELKAVPPEGRVDGELIVTIIGNDQWVQV